MQETIAIVFDFDDTLAPDSTGGFLKQCGMDVREFWDKDVKSLVDGDWDPIPAYLYTMIERSACGEVPAFTRDRLKSWGRKLPLFPGVETVFDRLRATMEKEDPRLHLEYYLISSGIGDVIRNTKIASKFKMIWTSEFHYDAEGPEGQITFPKKIISFTDKTRYLFHIQKGLVGPESLGKPFAVNKKYDDKDLRIPFKNMIVVGDGYTDIPCFSMIRKAGGTAIAVYNRDANKEKRARAWGFIDENRAATLHHVDYQEGSELSASLEMAISALAGKLSNQGT